ncbi:uncharacterized protein LOC124121026 [Haliotis rufescens]|uniref:uncharacterized protein LOC124121026 n=1 Tax=Haliotis rufescens TaxID=6454 RepID=UPI00201ED6E7|nr:uncharacterized protein LOC124121026 [Haliotis rufescens]
MNIFEVLLLLLAFSWQEKEAAASTKTASTSTTPAPTPTPVYTVACVSTEEAKLTLTDTKTFKVHLPPGCSSTGPPYTLTRPCLGKTVYIYKIPQTTASFVGGDGTIALTITCEVPKDGVTAMPHVSVKMMPSVTPTVENHPFTEVTMALSTTDPHTPLTTPSQTALGDHLYLVIMSEPKKGGSNILIPEICSAKDGKDTVKLWNLKQDAGKCGSLEPTLIGNFTVANTPVTYGTKTEDVAYADIYAFMFPNSGTITYECTVLVCPKNGTGQCATELTSNNNCLKSTARKRRSVNNVGNTTATTHFRRTVSATLTVSDFKGISEGSNARAEGLLLLVPMLTSFLLSK